MINLLHSSWELMKPLESDDDEEDARDWEHLRSTWSKLEAMWKSSSGGGGDQIDEDGTNNDIASEGLDARHDDVAMMDYQGEGGVADENVIDRSVESKFATGTQDEQTPSSKCMARVSAGATGKGGADGDVATRPAAGLQGIHSSVETAAKSLAEEPGSTAAASAPNGSSPTQAGGAPAASPIGGVSASTCSEWVANAATSSSSSSQTNGHMVNDSSKIVPGSEASTRVVETGPGVSPVGAEIVKSVIDPGVASTAVQSKDVGVSTTNNSFTKDESTGGVTRKDQVPCVEGGEQPSGYSSEIQKDSQGVVQDAGEATAVGGSGTACRFRKRARVGDEGDQSKYGTDCEKIDSTNYCSAPLASSGGAMVGSHTSAGAAASTPGPAVGGSSVVPAPMASSFGDAGATRGVDISTSIPQQSKEADPVSQNTTSSTSEVESEVPKAEKASSHSRVTAPDDSSKDTGRTKAPKSVRLEPVRGTKFETPPEYNPADFADPMEPMLRAAANGLNRHRSLKVPTTPQ